MSSVRIIQDEYGSFSEFFVEKNGGVRKEDSSSIFPPATTNQIITSVEGEKVEDSSFKKWNLLQVSEKKHMCR